MSTKAPSPMSYRIERSVLTGFFLVSMVSLSFLLIRGILLLFPDQLYPLVAGLLLYTALTVVLGAYMHTISFIPYRLAGAFDPIKNDIASGVIRDEAQLARRITAFTVDFFDFAFLDIAHAFLHTERSGMVSHEELQSPERAMEAFGMLEMSKGLEGMVRAGKIDEGGKQYHLYILPLWFGERWLGYMGLLSPRRIGRFTRRYLEAFENNYLDDQLMIVQDPRD